MNDYKYYEQLSVIIKIQDYIFENEHKIISNWHKEGNDNDDTVCIGLYYFDMVIRSDYLELMIKIMIFEKMVYYEQASIYHNH